MKNLSKTAGQKEGVTKDLTTTTSRGFRSNSRSACKKKLTQKNTTLLQKLKGLAADAKDDEEIVLDLTPQ